MTSTPWQHDLALLARGSVVGIDEVGRGCVAGAIVACAIEITSPDMLECLRGLPVKDSKALSALWRQKIVAAATSFTPRFALRDAAAIDRFGIQACNDVIITELANAFSPEHCVMVDGLQNGIPARVVRIIKGESVSIAIALASILAKEHRDALLLRLDAEYPLYGFAGHKGYGTELHLNAIREHGLIPGIHRRSFLKNIVCRRPAAIIAPLVA